MTRLAALHARITGDSKGFVSAATQAEEAAEKATTSMGPKGLGGSATVVRGAFTRLSTSPGMRMLPIQLSQVAQQAAAGGGVMRALTIQAADIGLAFGTLGAIIGTLATIGMPLLIGAFSSAGDEMDGLGEEVDNLRAAYNDIANQQQTLIDLRKQYVEAMANGQVTIATALREEIDLRSNIIRIQRAQLRNEQASVRAAIADREKEVDLIREQVEAEIAMLDPLLTQEQRRAKAVEITQRHIAENQHLFTELQRQKLEYELLEFQIEQIDQGLKEVVGTTEQLTEAGEEAREEFERLARLAMTFGNPNALAGLSGSDLLPPGVGDDGGGGGGRGTGGSQDTTQQDLERLRESLLSELEVEREHHNMRNELLKEAKERELLTNEEYNDLIEKERKRHHEQMAALDVFRYGSNLDQTEAFLGQMAAAFSSGNEEMLRIAKVFAAGEALVNAWRTYSQVMADPSLPWFAKLPAAISLFGSAVQAVSAIQGVGKGGSGRTTASGSSSGAETATTETAPTQSRSLTLIGDRFNRAQAIEIAEFMNDGTDDGLVIRGRS